MLGQLIWWSSIALEMLLLVRGLYSRLAYRLPVFYSYIGFVVLQEIQFVSQLTHDFWFYAYSASYVTALSLWLVHLWSYEPIPQSKASLDLEYQRIAAGTRRRLQETRGYLQKVVRS